MGKVCFRLIFLFSFCFRLSLECGNEFGQDLISKAFAPYCYNSQVAQRLDNSVAAESEIVGQISRKPKIDSTTFDEKQAKASSLSFSAGNQTYDVVLANNTSKLSENFTNRITVEQSVDNPALLSTGLVSDLDGSSLKEGKFIFPLPVGIYQYTPNQPLPLGSLFVLAVLVIIPFIPFGAIEITFPMGWDANYLALRLNGQPDNSGIVSGRSFEQDQFDLYGYVEGMLSNTFAIDGKACVQRLICELAEVPIRDTNMLGEALHFLVDPRKGKTKKLEDYLEAETQGLTYGNCDEVYGQCPLTIRKILPEKFVNKAIMKKKKK